MIAKILPIFVLLVATHQATVENKSVEIQKPQLPSSPDAPASAAQKELPLSGIDLEKANCTIAQKYQVFLLLPHFTDCSKFFMCVHGEEVEFSCAAGGLYFDFPLQTCNWSWATKCVLRTPEPSEVEGSGEDDFSWLTDRAESQSGVVGTLTGDAVANSVRPTSLEYPGSNGALNCMRFDSAPRMMPYKNDCQRYWHCVNGVPKTAYCTDGLYFNYLTQQCDFEANVKCHVELEDELKTEFMISK